MITQRPADLVAQSAAVQIPLVSDAQLVPGAILVGPLMQQAWRVVGIEVSADRVILETVPQPQMWVEHRHSFREGVMACSCSSARRVPIHSVGEIIGLLAPAGRPAKAFVLQLPEGRAAAGADPFTVYLTHTGATVRWDAADAAWQSNLVLPAIPLLYPIWTLPEALRPLRPEPHPEEARVEGNAAVIPTDPIDADDDTDDDLLPDDDDDTDT